jgi:hypothetical protein
MQENLFSNIRNEISLKTKAPQYAGLIKKQRDLFYGHT